MIDLNLIPQQLSRLSSVSLESDFIAISIAVNSEGLGYHSGLVLCQNGNVIYLHFDGKVSLEDLIEIPDNIYIKELTILNKNFLSTYKNIFNAIASEADPTYGYVIHSAFYDENAKYYAEDGIPDIVTCVGFCINVIQSLLYNSAQYLNLDEWDSASLNQIAEENLYLVEMTRSHLQEVVPNLSDELLENIVKRIMPSELTSSGFFNQLPISKQSISQINPTVEQYLLSNYLTA